MSRIGNKSITIPAEVTVDVKGSVVTVTGPKGTLTKEFSKLITIAIEENIIHVRRSDDEKTTKQLHGTTRALINNMVIGVKDGFKKTLTIVGRGYNATQQGASIVIAAGYSHTVPVQPIPGTTIKVVTPTEVEVSGTSKEDVGQLASVIRGVREPEPYKGKGISYKGEKINRKQGKKAQKK
jgi:large subunit ribosomal protein L6